MSALSELGNRRWKTSSAVPSRLLSRLIFAAGLLAQVSSQLQVISTESNQPFSDPGRITVGLASDLVVQVKCQNASMDNSAIQWTYAVNGSVVDMGLRPFGTSQANGVLRIYPVNVLTGNGTMFQCSDESSTLNVTFDLADSLFFLNPIPPAISVFDNQLGVCQVPDIPAAQVTTVNETNPTTGRDYFYCQVSTRRGTFRSRSVIVLPAPSFQYEPQNVTAQPINGTATAAFSCAVTPALGLIQIQWQFEMMAFGSGSGRGTGLAPGLTSGMLTNSSDGVTIVEPADSGTSILILDSVGAEHEGFYSCVALLSDGTMLTSDQASLIYDSTSLGDIDVIILAPPINITVTEGDTVSLPCVGSRGTSPTFTLGGVSQTSSQYSLDLVSIATTAAGDYVCQIGTTANTVSVSVTPLTRPPVQPAPITVITGATPPYAPEIIQLTSLPFIRCSRVPPGRWLINGSIFSSVNPNLRPTIGGVYQCVGAVSGLPETEFAGENGHDFYLLNPVADISAVISNPITTTFMFGQNAELILNCSFGSNPLPLLEWSRDGVSVEGVQAPTGFMETAFSILSVNITELGVGTHNFQCIATVNTSANNPMVTNSGLTSITIEPLLQNISITPEMQTFVLRDNNPNMSVSVNCSVVANPPPRFVWTRNGVVVQGEPSVTIEEFEFSSTLSMTLSELGPGTHSIVCSALPDIDNPTVNISDMATIAVNTPPTFVTDPQSLTAIVGDFVSLNCSAQATPTPDITWMYTFSNDTTVTVIEDATFNISSQLSDEENVRTSVLTFFADLTMADVNRFFCVANNTVTSVMSNTSIVTIQSMPVFTLDPESIIAIVDDQITLNCSAEAMPIAPYIIWVNGNGERIVDGDIFSISSLLAEDSNSVTSRLTFTATAENSNSTGTGNGSEFQCVATVRVEIIEKNLTEESEAANITIAGVPGSPSPVDINDITSRTALVAWQPSFSLIDIINYNVFVYENVSGGVEEFRENVTIAGDVTVLNLTNQILRPNRLYRVSVVAYNRAGRGEEGRSILFPTLEDVPERSPNFTFVSSTLLRQINLSWTIVEPEFQNGNIINYTIRFFVVNDRNNRNGDFEYKTVLGLSTILTADDNITAGFTYNISVAGNTVIGRGPFNNGVRQSTISQPVTPGTFIVDTNAITETTIRITLPSIPGAGPNTFSHFWVIAMKYEEDSSFSLSDSADIQFPNNNSFVPYSENIPVNTPYVVAEIDATRITISESTSFLLGDETATASLNDQPSRYRNGPLSAGTEYTAFLWGFPPSVPDGELNKRQAQSTPRQYNVFSSSRFLSPVSTRTPVTGLSGGIIAAIILVIILVCVAVFALIAAFVLYNRWRVKTEYIPPPSRKGSMRLRDKREVILQDSSTASLIKNVRAESELQQLTPDDVRLPVIVEEFANYCKMMHANSDHLFSEEYEILTIKSPSLAHIQCSMPHNVHKNRYANINCYDESRVHLGLLTGVEGSDYINANYIDGYQRKCAYVATQGPLPNTTYDFWRMVWELNSCCIIMLTNLVEKSRAKCHQYWPEVGSLSLGDLTVTLIEVQQLAYYTIRTYRMSRGNDRREVKQFHYTGWPDFGVPDHPNPVIAFIRRLANFKRTTDGPDIIHCSAGVGRTGTLITIQSMMQMMSEEGKLDIFNFVLGMRRQRNYMVQTERQYIFTHDAMLELMKVGDTEIPIQSLRRRYKELLAQDPNTESSRMETEFSHLNELEKIDESQFQAAKMTVNLPKNRFQDILPYERYRVRLLLHPGVSGSDYMNASYIDGYQQRHQYIVTQGPLKDTVDDFWRMVWEHRASTIMMLCQLEEKGKEQCVRYWPNEKIRQHGDMFVELTQVTEFATYTMREFSITNTKINESRTIKQYQYTDWLEEQNPSNAAAIIDLIGVLQKSQHNNGGGPIIVHDSTSIGRAGTFCVMSSVLEQLKVEGIVDLFFTIHSLRQQQPGLVQTYEQYKFCYQAVIEFLDSFDHYANFD